jgi:hypothetical protein
MGDALGGFIFGAILAFVCTIMILNETWKSQLVGHGCAQYGINPQTGQITFSVYSTNGTPWIIK